MIVNEQIFDSALRHAITVRRFTTGQVREVLALLEQADAEIVEMLRSRLRSSMTYESARLQALLRSIRERRSEIMAELARKMRDDMRGFVTLEHRAEKAIIEGALPVQLELATVELATLRSLVTTTPFAGHTLGQWFDGLVVADRRRLLGAIRMGVVQGEGIDTIVRRVIGTRSRAYRDGVLSITRRNAEAVVRTAVNAMSNNAREELWRANADIIGALRWTSTLDGRTTPVCMARDGHLVAVGGFELPSDAKRLDPPTARPPAHVSCRSVMVPAIDDEGFAARIGDRPMVRDTRGRRQRERDFRAEAKARAGQRWRGMSERDRRALIRAERNDWAARTVGTVPGETTYQQWLSRQPAAFQDEVLGRTKGKLFRDGGLELDQYVDRRGNELTLAELADRHPDAFIQAGFAPGEF